ncbi:outer membrane usher protein [Kluyvera sp. STS39-E]|uniref:outer membrane usher protein n=1 Tax=Kluyvera sp. STS39-E TaxID=3234748 RepID=UPI0034C64F07
MSPKESIFPRTTLGAALITCIWGQGVSAAENIEYDSSFLMGGAASSIDISRFSEGNPTPAGIYDVNTTVNDASAAGLSIPFVDTGGKTAHACLTRKNLAQLHIRLPEHIDENAILLKRDGENEDCLNLPRLIEGATLSYNNGDQQLNIQVPQAWLVKKYHDDIDPSLWDEGINAALLSYSANAYHSNTGESHSDSIYSGLNAGINLGAWRLRARGNYSWNSDGQSAFDFQNRYLQRDLSTLRSQLILGESYTTGETFDSVSIRGARLYSDARMLPSALAGFSPIIRGVANTNAKVTVTQGGYKIYEATVPPGAFVIDDLTPSGYGNDLVVTVEEADHSKHTFTQPFSSVIQMQRPGIGRWDISAGKVVNNQLRHEPNLIQGSFYYGLNNFLTGYTGIQMTDDNYLAGLLGVGLNTPMGAFALDVTHSKTDIPDDKTYQGQSYRLSWNKLFGPTDTSLNLAAYRYSTQDYLGLNDALTLIDDARNTSNGSSKNTMNNYSRLRNQFTVSINQPLKIDNTDYGSFYLSGSWSDYWQDDHSRSDYSMGYSKGVSWGSYTVSVQRTWNESGQKDDAVYLSFSIPLNNFTGGATPRSGFRSVDAQMNSDMKGNHQFNLSSNGGSEDNTVSYSLNTSYAIQNQDKNLSSVGGYASYESPWGSLSGSASANNEQNRQYSLSTDGGFILHRGGLTFTNDNFSDNDTLVLVKAPGAKGARINYGNNTIDRWGYGAASALSAYHENQVSLNIDNMEDDVELKSTSTTVIPGNGAVIFSNFETDQRLAAVINITRDDGLPLPFAADVSENGQSIGTVGQGGQAFVRGIGPQGELTLRWNEKSQQKQCRAEYRFPETPLTIGQSKMLLLNNVICKSTSGQGAQ